MARLLKNDRIVTGSNAIQLPVGNTSSRPSAPVNGQIRFNTDIQRFEIYYNSWQTIAINGNVNVTTDSFTGDGSNPTFTLTKTPPDINGILVFVGSLHQIPTVNFTLSNNTITFATAPPSGQTIVVFHGFTSTDAN